MMTGMLNDLYRNPVNRINKNKTNVKKNSVEDMVEQNKVALNLSHGKGKRKKHKSKKK